MAKSKKGKNKKMILQFKENSSALTQEITVAITEKEASVFCNNSEYLDKSGDTLIVKETFFIDKKVKDKWRYNLKYNNDWHLTKPNGLPIICNPSSGDFYLEDKDIQSDNLDDNIPVILVILESPHKDEYRDDDFFPLSPANGDTGVYFSKYFTSHALLILISLGLNLDDNQQYKIFFVNPVPYQASLYKIHGKGVQDTLRDKIWKQLYPLCKVDFEARIRSYKPKIILNSCTSVLKDPVQTELERICCQSIIIFQNYSGPQNPDNSLSYAQS